MSTAQRCRRTQVATAAGLGHSDRAGRRGIRGRSNSRPGARRACFSAIVVIGPGSARIDATLGANQLGKVRIEQAPVEVRAIGSRTTLGGTVSAIDQKTTSTGGTVGYPVQISA